MWFSDDYVLSTTSTDYTLNDAYAKHVNGTGFFGFSMVWDGVSPGATICMYFSNRNSNVYQRCIDDASFNNIQ